LKKSRTLPPLAQNAKRLMHNAALSLSV